MQEKTMQKTASLESVLREMRSNPSDATLGLLMQMIGINDPNQHKIITEVEFSKETKKVIVPEGMSKKEAATDLMNQWTNEEQIQAFDTYFEGWEWKDALRAFRNVLEEKFGWIKGYETMWSTPTEIDIVTSFKNGQPQTEKAFIGNVKFPSFEDAVGEVGINRSGTTYVHIKAKRKFGVEISTFFKEIHNYLLNNSIYRAKPIVVTEKKRGEATVIDLEITELIANNKIVLNEDEELTAQNFIIDGLDDEGKHTYLFTGSYGNGKTETALRIGTEGLKRGMSFFYVKDSSIFEKVLTFAKNYEPCIIFLEDVDEIASGTERTERMNQILNTIDGIQTKGRNMHVIFTTNHHQRINPALRRPGRIDLIIDFKNPNKDTQSKILLALFEGLNGVENLEMDRIVSKLPDVQGAVIAEIGKRAHKLAMKRNLITTEIVLATIASMDYQIQFMKQEVEGSNKLMEAFNLVRDYNHYNLELPRVEVSRE